MRSADIDKTANRTFEIYPERQLVLVRFSGPIDYRDILEWLDEALAHPSFSREYDGIVDYTNAVFKAARLEKVRLLASYVTEHQFTKGKWALLASTPMEAALSHIYTETLTLQHPIKIFSTVAAVAKFLGKRLDGIDLGAGN